MSDNVESLGEATQELSAFYYTAASHNILLESDIKTEIVDELTIFPMPHAPEWCSGMISLRGKIIPVLDMAHALNTEQQSKTRWLLVLESSPFPQIAIKIDKLPARISYQEKKLNELDNKQPNWLTQIIEEDEITLFKADHNKLFQQLIDHNQALQVAKNTETNSKQESSEGEV